MFIAFLGFNAKMVRVKFIMVAIAAAVQLSFNAKMVRVKWSFADNIDYLLPFQCQNGAS